MGALGGKHIVIVPAWWPSPEAPQAGVFFQDYAEAFARAGAKVGVIFPDLIPLRHLLKRGKKPLRPTVMFESCAGNVPVVRVRGVFSAFGRPAAQMQRFRDWLVKGLVAYQAEHGRPNVLHAFCTLPGGWAVTNLSTEFARPVVITEHTGPFGDVVRHPVAAKFAQAALGKADAAIAVSDLLAADMKRHGVERAIAVCGNPVSSTFTHAAISKRTTTDTSRGLFVGRFTVEKGVRELMTAIDRLHEEGANLEWRLVGPVQRQEADALSARLQEGRVSMTGSVSREETVREMQNADLLVLPSYGETFGLAAAEALCMGLPVITTRGTACAGFIDDYNGILCDPKDADSLYDAISKMLARLDEYDREAIAFQARARFSASGRRGLAREFV